MAQDKSGDGTGADLAQLLAEALRQHQAGRLDGAEAAYDQILARDPSHADALHLLGVLRHQRGDHQRGVELVLRAIAQNESCAVFHANLGSILAALGSLAEAQAAYERAILLQPDYADAHYNLGNVLKDQGKPQAAVDSYGEAVRLRPEHAKGHGNLAMVLMQIGKPEEAVLAGQRAVSLNPDFPEAHNNLGLALGELCRFDDAEAAIARALSLKPNFVEAHNNLGVVLNSQGKLAQAAESFERALALRPDSAESCNNLGRVRQRQGRLAEAEACFRRALALEPGYAYAASNLGFALQERGAVSEAVDYYRRALALDPQSLAVRSNLVFTLACADLPSIEEARLYGTFARRKVASPFDAWRCGTAPERLHVGLLSGDLGFHPVGFFLENVLREIDPHRVQLLAFPTQPRLDALAARLQGLCAGWHPVYGLSDEQAARRIHDSGLHLLLDLGGHTPSNRLPILAWKPAPVQASWLGYFATTGVAEIDFLLADPFVVPEGQERQFTERVWRLPETYRCFTPPDDAPEIGPLPALSAGFVTFGCFNNVAKLTDEVVAVWSRILASLPGARLLLKAPQLGDAATVSTVRRRFATQGIEPERLLLEESSPRPEMLAAYNRVDLLLDPFPYPGGTTSLEALWMGVPLVTLRGHSMLSRGGESIAANLGMPNYIADSADDYIAKALTAAADWKALAGIRAGLRRRVQASPLCDAARFARHFEAALWGMWRAR